MNGLTRHPAPWNRKALAAAADRVVQILGERPLTVLDPFAGTGRVHELRDRGLVTVGIELEPEWAAWSEYTIVGDALRSPHAGASIDAVVTSPAWGNRMADSHEARERCSRCEGRGCEVCGGAGRREYRRNTYRHALGRMPTGGSSAVMQFGPAYRRLHASWLAEARRLLRPGGVLVVNVANHVRQGVEVDVVGWWLGAILGDGFVVRAVDWVAAAKLRQGANSDLRVDGEVNVVAQVRP